ncbi:MAG: hypothetical protein PHU52_06275 [Dehalococcoidales bacterium]|nr:hypothetical protein [Dehalococcoidales bacterium]
MIEINEVIMFIVGAGLFLFIRLNAHYLTGIPHIKILTISFYILFTAFILTILEGLFLENIISFLEHICYALSSIFLLIWCYAVLIRKSVS